MARKSSIIVALLMVLGSAGAGAATERSGDALRPLVNRSSAAPIYDTNRTADIVAHELHASGGRISAAVTLGGARPSVGETLVTLALFQTDLYDAPQVIGVSPPVTWSPGTTTAEGGRWFVAMIEEGGPVAPTCVAGYFTYTGGASAASPAGSGAFVPLSPASCARAGNTVALSIPYALSWTTPTGLARSVRVAQPGSDVRAISAMTWLDHNVEAPSPVGLLLGITSIADWAPDASFDFGLVHDSPWRIYDAGCDCSQRNPYGPGFGSGFGGSTVAG